MAASADSAEKAREVANEVSFPVAHGVTREIADGLGAWWGDQPDPGIIQPSEFIVDRHGKIVHSSYSSGPLARMDAGDVINMIRRIEKYK